jgi:hypothetical protein
LGDNESHCERVAFAFHELVHRERGKGDTMKQVETASEEFIRLMQVLAGDKDLQQWFLSLEKLPENLRYSLIRGMAERMHADKIDRDLVEALRSLTSPEVYKAAASTIRDFSR